jgi:hypothetical protein
VVSATAANASPPAGVEIVDPHGAPEPGERLDIPDDVGSQPEQVLDRSERQIRTAAVNAPERSLADTSARGVASKRGEGEGELVIQSSISGARIILDGKSDPHWVTPHLFYLAPGDYQVSVSMGGFSTWSRRVHITRGKDQWLMADMASNENGVFTLETEPPGMQVFIDGRPYGPSRVDAVLQPGWHVCEVITEPGAKPLVGRFHLDPGKALTRRIRVGPSTTSSTSGELPGRQVRPASSQGERLE